MKKKNNQSFKKVTKNNWFLFKICFKAAPWYTSLRIFEMIRNEFVIFLEFTIAFNFVLECAEFGRPFKTAGILLASILGFVILGLLFNSYLYQKIQLKSEAKIKQALKNTLFMKAKVIDLQCYDNTQFYNDYVLAVSEAENQVNRMYELLSMIFTGVTSIICSGAFIISKNPISLIFVLLSFILSLVSGKAINKLNFKIRVEKNPHERKLLYFNRVFYLNDYAKEIRLNTQVADKIMDDFDNTNHKVLEFDKKNAKKRFALEFLNRYICNSFIIDVLYMIYLVYNAVVLKGISYSNVAVLRSTTNRAKNRLGLLSEVYPKALEISLYVDKIQKYLTIEPKIISKENKQLPNKATEIELRNVSFGYSKNAGYIIKGINMKINPLSKIAIVGYNGAGKTTLIKLIMRLYDPCEGEILLDGVNIKEYNVEEYRKKIGTVFQDFKIFAATVKENVLLDFEEKGNDENVLDALEKSGFSSRLATLENGLQTNLTTEFNKDGVNLSGGEAQKLAISRVFYKDTNLIILDEPSSALDPIAEYHINKSMVEATENKSVVFISHRLSTTRLADKIYMLENGKIIESGNHTELLLTDGKYAEMWRVQSGQYINS